MQIAVNVTSTAYTLTLPAAVSLGTTGLQGYTSILGGANNNIYQDNSFAGITPNYSVIVGGDTNRYLYIYFPFV